MNGSYSHTNLAVRCLRPGLEKSGYDVQLAEYQLRDRTGHVLNDLYQLDGDIYGFSVYIWNLDIVTELSRELKKIKPNIHIIWGGPEVSFETERFESYDYIDNIITGEGEISIVNVCNAIKNGQPLSKVVIGQPSSEVMKDEGILYREGENSSSRLFYYESSRGCPFRCAYCLSSINEGVRMKPVEQVLLDLHEFEKFSDQCIVIKFVDRTFNANVERANKIWEALLSDEFSLKYHFEICATLLNEKSFEILSKFPKGKIQLEVGLQSTNEETLGAVSRHLNPKIVIDASKRILDMKNMDIYLDLIAGLPYEGIDSFKKSFNESYDACTRLQVGFLKLLPGTSLRDDAEKYGIKYMEKAPYTVLETKWLSFSDMMKIHSVHELNERFCEGGNFKNTLAYIRESIESPFDFWCDFDKYIMGKDGREIQKISQVDAYGLLLLYCDENGIMSKEKLFPVLATDFNANEKKRIPVEKWGVQITN